MTEKKKCDFCNETVPALIRKLCPTCYARAIKNERDIGEFTAAYLRPRLPRHVCPKCKKEETTAKFCRACSFKYKAEMAKKGVIVGSPNITVEKVLEEVTKYRDQNDGKYPTAQIIAKALGCSYSTVRIRLVALQGSGKISGSWRGTPGRKKSDRPERMIQVIKKLNELSLSLSHLPSMQEIGEALGMSKQGANLLVRALEKNGLVSIETRLTDKAKMLIEIGANRIPDTFSAEVGTCTETKVQVPSVAAKTTGRPIGKKNVKQQKAPKKLQGKAKK